MNVLLLNKKKVFQKYLVLAVRMCPSSNLNHIIFLPKPSYYPPFQHFTGCNVTIYNAPSTSQPPLTDVTNNI